MPTFDIHTRIYRVRGQQVMFDEDLAKLYEVPTKRLNEQVGRNTLRFPPEFMFQLTDYEVNILRSQIATSKSGSGGRRYRPYAFTEHGIAMLSSVLNSERAIQVNIAIIKTFIKLRHAILSNRDLSRRVEKLEGKVDMHETDIRLIVQDLDRLKKRSPEGPIDPAVV